ncbi:MAG: Ig-like domain-containing protein [Archangium sp.]|nr:Ig-like domain-containing protein [Archangium sp.]
MRSVALAALVVTSLATAGCENVDYIELSPSEVTFKAAGEMKYLEAKCMSRAGQRATTAKVAWSVKDPAVASVDPNGTVRPLKAGSTEVVARYGGKVEARAAVNVLFVEKISVSPDSVTIVEGQPAVPVTVTSYGFDGRALDARPATFVSKNKEVATVVGGNSILGLDPGSTVVEVSVDGKKADVQVTVQAEAKKK